MAGLVVLLAACAAEEAPAPAAAEPEVPVLAAPVGTDWSTCRFQNLRLPVPGRLFVVDAGAPLEDSEPGRETIRRVDVMVPGQVSLLLTASHATAWHVRPWPETEVVAIFASGAGSQRITGAGLGEHRMERSQDLGDDCGRHWMAEGPGPAVAEAARQVFGRVPDAYYRMRVGSVVIGSTEATPELLEAR
ncbi:hypothetical protein [Arenimonas fontis]|uniref:Uncharacterized protein n=1 Tax=Arenimonas fontis TaxID=2608255 RepID=A0A5B2Z6Z3_9GAMM|nr:hypothetical protein [Arenimonas fontis]KAA2283966.1 hypothetical protein F0415_11720 [Arenimonas fontis]